MSVLESVCILLLGFLIGAIFMAVIFSAMINSELKSIERETKDLHGHNIHR